MVKAFDLIPKLHTLCCYTLYQPLLVMRSHGEPQSSTVKAITALCYKTLKLIKLDGVGPVDKRPSTD